MQTVHTVRLPKDTDMVKLRKRLKLININGKTANAKIAAYILKLAK